MGKKVILDLKKCARCGMCVSVVPSVFGFAENGEIEIVAQPNDFSETEDFVPMCPGGAISVSDESNSDEIETKTDSEEKLEITRDTKIGAAIARFPEIIEIFLDFGLGCVSCPHAAHETLADGAAKHGIDDDELDDLLRKLNDAIAE
jgi:hybrid cluster-associated redox disulfide protein